MKTSTILYNCCRAALNNARGLLRLAPRNEWMRSDMKRSFDYQIADFKRLRALAREERRAEKARATA